MRIGVLAAAVGVVAAAGCGDDQQEAASPPPAKPKKAVAATKAKQSAGSATYVKLRKTRYGRILTDGRGRALYLFTKEKGKKPACYGACAAAWPVFHARGAPRAGKGVRQALLGSSPRSDGRRQMTYNGHPLYYYVTDKAPGQVTCQNVAEYGGTWLVIAPSGKAIL